MQDLCSMFSSNEKKFRGGGFLEEGEIIEPEIMALSQETFEEPEMEG
jgi:hypothetical protein